MRNRILLSAILALAAFQMPAMAQVTLNPLFTDHMVLQQKASVPVWGKAAPGAEVTVTPSWSRKSVQAVADADGNWSVELQTPKGSFKEYTLTISDGTPVVLNDVLVGEVWLCSGQSNMQMPVESWRAKRVNGELIESSVRYTGMRLLQVSRCTGMSERDSFSADFGGWQRPSPRTVRNFSAISWFFGRDLQEKLKVPVGLIHSSVGGTIIEAWMSRGAMSEFPEVAETLEYVRTLSEDEGERERTYRGEMMKLFAEAHEKDAGLREHWERPSFNASSWTDIKLPNMVQTLWPGVNGVYWFRKEVEIPASWAGKDLVLSLGPVDDFDETYWNGVQVGCDSVWSMPREYTVPASLVKAGRTVITVRNTDDHGNGGLYGTAEQMFIQGPDGEKIALDDVWKVKLAVSFENIPVNTARETNLPTVLYNGMIKPLAPYRIAGVIWYQGESNAERAPRYRDLMPSMILDWRALWGYDFPFYITQIANYKPVKAEPGRSDWAELREAQSLAAGRMDGVEMACIIDIGEADDVHPIDKKDAGERLSRLALARQYGHRKLFCNGPRMRSFKIHDGYVTVLFSDVAGGLCARTSGDFAEARYGVDGLALDLVKQAEQGVLTGFQVAGPDGVWHWAEAKILMAHKPLGMRHSVQEVAVSSPEVKHPVAVRYGWADNPVCNLYNSEGLPAWPFRTDLHSAH